MYAKVGLIKDFSGSDYPHKIPETSDTGIDASEYSPEVVAQTILLRLEKLGYIK